MASSRPQRAEDRSLTFCVIGVVSGALGALLGIGGGVILVPLLSVFGGLGFREAIGTSLVAIAGVSVAGSAVHLRRSVVDVPTALALQCVAALGAVLAGAVSPLIPEAPLHFLFAGLLLVTVYYMWPTRAPAGARLQRLGGNRAIGVSASFAAGVLAGLLGVGGGIFNTPLLHLVFRLSFYEAAATSVFMIGVTASAASIVYLARGDVMVGVAGVTMLGAMLGAFGVAYIGNRVRQRVLAVVFALVMLGIALEMVRRGVAAL